MFSDTSKREVGLEINVGNGNFNESVVGPLRFEKQNFSSADVPIITGIFQNSGSCPNNGEIEMAH